MLSQEKTFILAAGSHNFQTFFVAENYSVVLLMPLKEHYLAHNLIFALLWDETDELVTHNMTKMLEQSKENGFISSFEFMVCRKKIDILP